MTENEQMLLALIETQRDHIDTQMRIIKHIQQELKLIYEPLKLDDKEEVKNIVTEIIDFIDNLKKEEDFDK